MATSGTAYTNTYKSSQFYCSWSRTSYSSSGNYSDISWSAGLYISGNDEWYSNAIRINSVVINGTTVMGSTTVSNKTGPGWFEMGSGTARIYHNNDGTKSFSISISGWLYSNHDLSGSDTFTLDTIPRYTSITSFTVSNITGNNGLTQLKFNWETADTIDYLWYSTNNGSNWTGYDVTDGTSGNFNVSNLSYNTSYDCKIRVRRKDSQLTTDSSKVTKSTYDIARVTTAPDINLGDNATITITNPAGASIKYFVEILNPTETVLKRDAATGSNTIIFEDSELDMIYRKMGTENSTTLRFGVATNESYWHWLDKICTLTGNQKTAHTNVEGTWKRGKIWINVTSGKSSTWKRGVVWQNVEGTWKRCI